MQQCRDTLRIAARCWLMQFNLKRLDLAKTLRKTGQNALLFDRAT
jgi:hypothetical protein